ncbi:MAG: glutathione S-transferase family protein, partial [Alphaproteobacteria bacterium]|nr:glutathione S-transferase family protein [Alphaproteobacteria bacterium]
MPTLFDYADSGNGYKIALLAAHLGIALDRVEIDITRGESRTAEFRALNPNGKVPVVQLDDGTLLTESNAILCHLAEDTRFLPAPGVARTRVLEWLFWEQYSHEPMIATLRYWARHVDAL